MLTGLAPLVSGGTRLLILGSFPGVRSLAQQQYYGHPRNQFWPVLQALWPDGPVGTVGSAADSYEARCAWLLSKGLGLWDVYAACEREGSLDSRIRQPVVNDFSALQRLCPHLQAIAHHGGESFKQARHSATLGLPVYRLPSTSPANASWTFERKLAVWHEVFTQQGLIQSDERFTSSPNI